MLDQVSAEGIGVSHKITKGSGCVGSGLLFLVSQKLYKERHTRLQVLIQDVVMEASVSYGEASKLPRVSIRVLAALNGRRDQPKLEQLLVEEPSMSAQVSDQVAYLCSNRRVFMDNQSFQRLVNVSIVNILIEVF